MASNIVHSFEVLTSQVAVGIATNPVCRAASHPGAIMYVKYLWMQLLGVKGDGWAVQGPLWIPELHSPQLEAFLEKASAEESQVQPVYLTVGLDVTSRLM